MSRLKGRLGEVPGNNALLLWSLTSNPRLPNTHQRADVLRKSDSSTWLIASYDRFVSVKPHIEPQADNCSLRLYPHIDEG